jgi:putative transposase
VIAEIAALRISVRATRARHPFHIDAWVVLPDHMHCLWTLPTGDVGFPIR